MPIVKAPDAIDNISTTHKDTSDECWFYKFFFHALFSTQNT